jgi:hypothetical protein
MMKCQSRTGMPVPRNTVTASEPEPEPGYYVTASYYVTNAGTWIMVSAERLGP